MNDYIGNIYKKEEQEIQPRICLINTCGSDSSSSCTGNFCTVNEQDGCFWLTCSSKIVSNDL